ncbi:MAG TPA: polysaccharide biosynthesis tyrosine autokinase [Gemmatimonadaceae bacterium]|nr:polysaccharide biosynthesis tyrosine autokinase [Gemmatimonadaceae bacterium]
MTHPPSSAGDSESLLLPDWEQTHIGRLDRDGRDIPRMLRRNIWLIIGSGIVAMGAAAVVTLRQTPVYEASASIRIDEKQSGLPALDILQTLSGSEVSTERQMLASRSVAEDVADSLALQVRLVRPVAVSRGALLADVHTDRDPGNARYRAERVSASQFSIRDSVGTALTVVGVNEALSLPGVKFRFTPAASRHQLIELEVVPFDEAVEELRSTVTIDRPDRAVNIIVVSYRTTDPRLARDVPNAIAARFIARRQKAGQTATRSTISFLRDQSSRMSVQLREAEDSLRDYRTREGLVSLPAQSSTQITRLAELQAQRGALETERSALARLVQLARDSAAKRPGDARPFRDVLAFPTLLRNESASQLLGSLNVIEDRRAELLSKRSPEDPDVKVLTVRAAELEDQLRRIGETYLQGLTDQVTSIDAALRKAEQRLETIPAQEARLAMLEREAKGYEEIYALLQSRLKEAEIAAAVQDGSVRVVDPALLPRSAVAPRPAVNLSVALVVGMLLGVSAGLMRELTDKSVHSRDDVHGITRRPVLGLLPDIRPARGLKRLGGTARWRETTAFGTSAVAVAANQGDGGSAAREAFNGLQAKIGLALAPETHRTLIVTSPTPGDGKTTVAINLAGTIARHGNRVLLIDADLRRGIVHTVFQLARSPGLSDVLSGAVDTVGAIRMVDVTDDRVLHVLACGTPNDDPAMVLAPAQMHALITQLALEFEWIIIDSPPLNVVADAALLGATGSGVLLVARAGVTSGDALAYATEQLHSVRAEIVGTILNGIDRRDASYDTSMYSYREYAATYESRLDRS